MELKDRLDLFDEIWFKSCDVTEVEEVEEVGEKYVEEYYFVVVARLKRNLSKSFDSEKKASEARLKFIQWVEDGK